MATNRIAWSLANSSMSGQFGTVSALTKLRSVLASLQSARDYLAELNQVIAKYNGDATTLGTDLGVSAADATAITNLVAQAHGELNSTATTQVNVGATTGTKQLVDALG